VVITKRGRPIAVVPSVEDLESLETTLAVLSDRKMIQEIRESLGEIALGSNRLLTKLRR
jgi:PHD/YefM family antitoxin component YafN of YafNO toxin-antitoxin module